MTKHILKTFIVSALLIANQTYASEIPLLNHNFESDAIPPDPGWTTHISGWVDGGYGEFGVYAPSDNSIYYTSVENKGQIAYLNQGARIYQTVNTSLLLNETYTLTFDVGQRLNHNNLHFAARMKANGLVLAQLSSAEINLIPDGWTSASLSFTASSEMPIGEPLVVEFSNLATTWQQVNIDNVFLSTAGTGTTAPGINLGTPTMIMEDRTLLVPDQYPNINVALRYLDDKQIKVGKTVTIQVTDCSNQVYNEPVNVAHPNGNAIHIVGNTNYPEQCALRFTGINGFVVNDGAKLGIIDGFHIKGNLTEETSGISADNGASVTTGANILISEFSFGFLATGNATIKADYAKAFNNDNGFYANGAMIIANYSEASNNSALGYTATNGGNLRALHSQAISNGNIGYYSTTGSNMLASYATATQNVNYGFAAQHMGSITAVYANVTGNKYGFGCHEKGYIYRRYSYVSGNTDNHYPNVGVIGHNDCLII